MVKFKLKENTEPFGSYVYPKALYYLYRPIINKLHQAFEVPEGLPSPELWEKLFNTPSLMHTERCQKILHTLADPENIRQALIRWPFDINNILSKLSRDLCILDNAIPAEFESGWSMAHSNVSMLLGQLFEKKEDNLYGVAKSYALYPIARFFKAEWAANPVVPRAIDKKDFKIYSCETTSANAVKTISEIIGNDRLEYRKSPRTYGNVELKMLSELTAIEEPIPKSGGKTSYYAARVLTSWCFEFMDRFKVSYPDFLSNFFCTKWRYPSSEIYYLMALPSYQGHTYSARINYGQTLLTSLVNMLFDQNEYEEQSGYLWLSTEDLYYAILRSPVYASLYNAYNSYRYASLDKVSSSLDWKDMFGLIFPLIVKGFCLMSAVLGLTEVAIKPDKKASMADVLYVRPTRLAAFATKRIDKYEPPVVRADAPLLLGEDSLTLIARKPAVLNMFEPIIDRKLSHNRAQVTLTSVISGLVDKDSIIRMRKNLKMMSKLDELPPVWDDLFNEAKENISYLSYNTRDYAVYQISSHYDLIRRLIKDDPRLSKAVIFAENGLMLVNGLNTFLLRDFLKRYGISIKYSEQYRYR